MNKKGWTKEGRKGQTKRYDELKKENKQKGERWYFFHI